MEDALIGGRYAHARFLYSLNTRAVANLKQAENCHVYLAYFYNDLFEVILKCREADFKHIDLKTDAMFAEKPTNMPQEVIKKP